MDVDLELELEQFSQSTSLTTVEKGLQLNHHHPLVIGYTQHMGVYFRETSLAALAGQTGRCFSKVRNACKVFLF